MNWFPSFRVRDALDHEPGAHGAERRGVLRGGERAAEEDPDCAHGRARGGGVPVGRAPLSDDLSGRHLAGEGTQRYCGLWENDNSMCKSLNCNWEHFCISKRFRPFKCLFKETCSSFKESTPCTGYGVVLSKLTLKTVLAKRPSYILLI